MVVDYFVVRRQHYDLPGLYLDAVRIRRGTSRVRGVSRAVAFTLVAITTGALQWFYTYGWFTGSFLGGIIYYLGSRWGMQKSAVAQSVAAQAYERRPLREDI
jgi:NCS1 family nucleobase:cation symporter-1